MTAIREHTDMHHVAARLSAHHGSPVTLPSYKQVRTEVHRLKREPALVAMREGAKSVARPRESAESFVLSIPAPALLTQVDEHTMDLYVVTPDGITVASRVHAAVLVCVKTAAILGAVLSLGPLKALGQASAGAERAPGRPGWMRACLALLRQASHYLP
jgi:hypothetical protein